MTGPEPKGFFGKLFKKAETDIATIKANYDSAAKNVEKITRNLENHQVTLMQSGKPEDAQAYNDYMNL